MFVNQEHREVATLGVAESNTFSIKANGKAFKVLIDGLYSNKILAVIRELWSNAYDSHAEAGCPERAFDCQLPTTWDPQFRVRDYGVSLSHDGVMRLYTTVFESTKEDTNAQVGKLGLGSKSPFAYTDTFTVTAWKDGEKRIYSAYIGEDYVPRIALLARETSDDPQGLEVAFPVQMTDTEKFKSAAERVALGFNVRPNTFDVELHNPHRAVLVEGDGWKLFESSDWNETASAKQGCVIYPIDPDAVNGATSTQRGLLKSPLFIDFPIGALEIAASREGLGYDKTTCANIVAKLAEIERAVIAHFEKEIADIKTRWAVAKRFAELKELNLPEAVIQCLDHMKWRGRKLQTKFNIRNQAGSGFTAHKVDRNVVTGGRSRHGDGWTSNPTNYWITPGNVHVFYIDPTTKLKHVKERIKHHYIGHLHSGDIVVVRAAPGSMFLKRFLVQAGRPTMINVADCPEPPKSSLPARKKTKLKVLSLSKWHETDVDTSLGGIYVNLDRGEIDGPTAGRSVGIWTAENVVGALTKLGLMPGELYGIPRSCKRVAKLPGWRSLWDVAAEAMQAYDPDKHGRYRAIIEMLDHHRGDHCGHLIQRWVEAKTRPAFPGLAQELYDLVDVLTTEQESLASALYDLAYHWPDNTTYVPRDQTFYHDKEYCEFNDVYPLCDHFGRDHVSALDAEHLLSYVNLIDAARVVSSSVSASDVASDISVDVAA
jgi:hypothetical protein